MTLPKYKYLLKCYISLKKIKWSYDSMYISLSQLHLAPCRYGFINSTLLWSTWVHLQLFYHIFLHVGCYKPSKKILRNKDGLFNSAKPFNPVVPNICSLAGQLVGKGTRLHELLVVWHTHSPTFTSWSMCPCAQGLAHCSHKWSCVHACTHRSTVCMAQFHIGHSPEVGHGPRVGDPWFNNNP